MNKTKNCGMLNYRYVESYHENQSNGECRHLSKHLRKISRLRAARVPGERQHSNFAVKCLRDAWREKAKIIDSFSCRAKPLLWIISSKLSTYNCRMQNSGNLVGVADNSCKLVKLVFCLLVVSLFLFIASSSTFAIGVSPGQVTADFEANGRKDVSIRVLNPSKAPMKFMVYAKGGLAEYTRFSRNIYAFTEGETEMTISYSIEFPAELNPGSHTTEIIIIQIPDTFSTGETTAIITSEGVILESKAERTKISTATGVISVFKVNVPYPGKYLEANFLVSEAAVGKTVYFNIPLMNFGNEDVQKAKAIVRVLTPLNQEVAKLETNELGIKAKQQDKLVAAWTANVNPGPYYVIATVDYDGRKITLEKKISIGDVRINIAKISTSEFRIGDIARFDIQLENEWSQQLNNVYAEVFILNKNGDALSSFKTAQIDIGSLSKGTIIAYWDTKGFNVGEYSMKIVLHYADKKTEKIVDVVVNIDSITTYLAPTALAVSKQPGSESSQSSGAKRDNILLLGILVLVAINIGWLIYIKKMKGPRSGGKEIGRQELGRKEPGGKEPVGSIGSISGGR